MEKEQHSISITPSLMLEYLYCPRFIFYMKVLEIPQNEETRFKVTEGRIVHTHKALTNQDYKRKKLGVIKKESEQKLYSETYHIHGKVDEVLFLDDGTAAPLDYKYALFKKKIYTTYKIQSVMYGLLIKGAYNIPVNRGFIVYTRSKNHLEQIDIGEKDFTRVQRNIEAILNIIQNNRYPGATSYKNRCLDCCYRNICSK